MYWAYLVRQFSFEKLGALAVAPSISAATA
jgi:hypothetical protein